MVAPGSSGADADEVGLGIGDEDEGASVGFVESELVGETAFAGSSDGVLDFHGPVAVEEDRGTIDEAVALVVVVRGLVGGGELEGEAIEAAGEFLAEDLAHPAAAMNAAAAVGSDVEEASGPAVGDESVCGVEGVVHAVR